MRILYSHRIQSRDGQAVHVEEMIAALREAGHEVVVCGPSFYGESGFGGSSRRIDLLRRLLPGALGELAELAYNIVTIRQLVAAWRAFQPDLVYERYNLFHLAGTWLARRHGARLFLEVNSPLADERARHGGLRLLTLARWVERLTWRSADRVLPVTAVLGRIIVAQGVEPAAIVVIPNAIVPARFPTQAAQTGRPTLGFLGFVRAWHGLDQVIDAMAADPMALDLVIAGDGPILPDLRAQAERLGLAARVRFTGLVPPEQVPALVTGFAIALQPQVTDYASPLKLFDYMAAGCAIVAPDQPNIREILVHDSNALLFDASQPGAMWAAITRLAGDQSLRARLGAAARAQALTHHSWVGNARRVVELASEPATQITEPAT
jgi:glycosyltransferase involved in cell wall biosynthesis